VHERFDSETLAERPRLLGWWGARASDRFQMAETHAPEAGAAAFALSNPPVLLIAVLRASLEMFDAAGGVAPLAAKAAALTAYLEARLADAAPAVRVITPRDAAARGAQLSLLLPDGVRVAHVQERLAKEGVFVDSREPAVLRVAAAPLYNSAADVFDFVHALVHVLGEIRFEEMRK